MNAKWLKERRKQINISQKDLAVRLQANGYNVSESAVSHWETGRYAMPLEDVGFRKALGDALNMSIKSILERSGYEISQRYSEQAMRAAEIVEKLSPDRQQLAMGLLEQLARV
jgi:transcriptional regulator with XRE-family HTH domain